MKKLVVFFAAIAMIFGVCGVSEATLISFLYEDGFENIDNSTGWSTDDAMLDLGVTSFSVLSEFGRVSSEGSADPSYLTQRGTRGLGIASGKEKDEVDRINYKEKLVITFNDPVFFHSVYLRSLFEETYNDQTFSEKARVNFFLGGIHLTSTLFDVYGSQTIGTGVGEVAIYPNLIADQVRFVIPDGGDETWALYSDFAVAKLEVESVPEPATMLLLGSGLLGLAGLRRKFKKS